jgi:hypothetical protein
MLVGGVALPSVAVGAGLAKADSLFTSFAFKATGGTENRTEPNRWADWHNVKDFGATGNGSTDDTAAIQAAIDWTMSDQRGTIYFPPGQYKTTAALDLYFGTGANQSIILRGDGMASHIVGTFNGYIIDRYDPDWMTPSGNIVIEKLFVTNGSDVIGSGAMRLGNCNNAVVRDCKIEAMNGIILSESDLDATFLSNNCAVINCSISCSNPGSLPFWTTGSNGIMTGNGTSLINMDIGTFDCAIRMCGTGCNMLSGRLEVNNYSVIFGVDHLGNSAPAIGCSAGGFTNESYLKGMFDLVNADGCCLYETGGSSFHAPTFGLRLQSGVANTTLLNVSASGVYEMGGTPIIIEDSTGSPGRGNTFIGCAASSGTGGIIPWTMPTKARTAQFINCNNTVPIFTFANLPTGSDVVFGDEYIISNSNVTVVAANFGATVTGGAPNVTAKVRWDGSNWIIV